MRNSRRERNRRDETAMTLSGGPPLRSSISQSGAELRAFVASLKGRTPAEAMGVVASSHLFKGMLLSFVIQAAVLLALTVPSILWPPKDQTPVAATPGIGAARTSATSPSPAALAPVPA